MVCVPHTIVYWGYIGIMEKTMETTELQQQQLLLLLPPMLVLLPDDSDSPPPPAKKLNQVDPSKLIGIQAFSLERAPRLPKSVGWFVKIWV